MTIFADPIIKKFKEELLLDKSLINSKGSQYSNYSNSIYVNFSSINKNTFQSGLSKEKENKKYNKKVFRI
jgi:hypothetical protein